MKAKRVSPAKKKLRADRARMSKMKKTIKAYRDVLITLHRIMPRIVTKFPEYKHEQSQIGVLVAPFVR